MGANTKLFMNVTVTLTPIQLCSEGDRYIVPVLQLGLMSVRISLVSLELRCSPRLTLMMLGVRSLLLLWSPCECMELKK